MDWFDPIPSSTPLPLSHDPSLANALFSAGLKPEPVEKLRSSLDHQILELKRVLVKGGEVYWRRYVIYLNLESFRSFQGDLSDDVV
jgi:betaine lipid synthase